MSDLIGLQTLQHLSSAKSFNRWLIEKIEPHLQDPILEVGSGIGNLTEILIEKNYKITATDIDPEYIEILKHKFTAVASNIEVKKMDINESDPSSHVKYKSILLINVMEHIEEDKNSLRKLSNLLDKDGKIIVLVPAYKWLYNPLDKNLGHFKRYGKDELKQMLRSAGYKVVNVSSFNMMGILGWFFWGSILRKKQLSKLVTTTYEWLMPINRIIDRVFMSRVGLSVIAIAQKNAD